MGNELKVENSARVQTELKWHEPVVLEFNDCVIIVIIIITIIISFMQCIYTYIPEANYVPREYSVAGILLLLFMVLISLVFSVESVVLLH